MGRCDFTTHHREHTTGTPLLTLVLLFLCVAAPLPLRVEQNKTRRNADDKKSANVMIQISSLSLQEGVCVHVCAPSPSPQRLERVLAPIW